MNDWERAIVQVYRRATCEGFEFLGTAFIIAPNLLLTAYHVIEGIEYQDVFLRGQAWSGPRAIENVLPHPNLDAALIKLSMCEKDIPIVPLANNGQCGLSVCQELEYIGFDSENADRARIKCTCIRYEGNSQVWVASRSVAKGMSGSPTVVDGRVVGILIWRHIDPHSQYSYVLTLDRLWEFLKLYLSDTSPELPARPVTVVESDSEVEVTGTALSDYLDWPLEIVGKSGPPTNMRILKLIKNYYDDPKTKLIVLKAKAGFGKSTVAKQFLDDLKNTRKLVFQIKETDPQSMLKLLGEQLGVIEAIDHLPTNIVYRIFRKLSLKDTVLVLDSFHYMQEQDGRITDGYIKQLLSHSLANTFDTRLVIIVATSRTISGIGPDAEGYKELDEGDFRLSEAEGLKLLKQRKIAGAPAVLRHLLADCDYNPGEIALIPKGMPLINAVNIKPHGGSTIRNRLYDNLYDNLGKIPRRLFFLLSLLNHSLNTHQLELLLADSQSPLRLSRRELEHSIVALNTSGLINYQGGLISAVSLYKHYYGKLYSAEARQDAIKYHEFLCDYYKAKYDPDKPDDLDPLYEAVWHGCRAGKLDESLKLFWERICRRREFYSQAKGYYHRDLTCLSEFFPNGETEAPAAELSEDAIEWLPSIYSYLRKNLGDVGKAIAIRESQIRFALERVEKATNRDAREPAYLLTSIDVSRLMQALVINGHPERAKTYYGKAVEYAEKGRQHPSSNYYSQYLTYESTMMMAEGKMGMVCYYLDQLELAKSHFEQAETKYNSRLVGADDVLYCEALMALSVRNGDPELMEMAKSRACDGLAMSCQTRNSERQGYYYYLKARIAERLSSDTEGIIADFDRALRFSEETNRTDMMTLFLIGKLHYLTRPELGDLIKTDPYRAIDEEINNAEEYAKCFELDLFLSDVDVIRLKKNAQAMNDLSYCRQELERKIRERRHFMALTRLNDLK
ncbi:MAG: trypsin-like peptidase domain-containing protein [Desulfobacteraceae bacterium]|jgi:hypothetical protein